MISSALRPAAPAAVTVCPRRTRVAAAAIVAAVAAALAINATPALASPPVATTGNATDITHTSATLNGTVNPNGVGPTECFFEYGETKAYGHTASCEETVAQIGNGTSPVPVQTKITGLATNPEYHYRLVTANGVPETVKGSDQNFSTVHVFSTSFSGGAGQGPALTNPTDVAIDQSNGDVYVANAAFNAQQNILVNATGGTFTLTFRGQTTGPIAFNASPQVVGYALQALPTIGAKAVEVGKGGGSYEIFFLNTLGLAPQPQLTADSSGLTGGAMTVQVTTTQPGLSAADVEKFTPAGEFILILGKEVNKTKVEEVGSTEAERDVCTAESHDECQPGAAGSSPGALDGAHVGVEDGQFRGEVNHNRLFLAVDNSPGGEGDLYVGDPGDDLISKFDSSGHLITAWGDHGQLDGSTGPKGDFQTTLFSHGVLGIALGPQGNLLVLAGVDGQFYQFAQNGAFLASEYFVSADSETVGFAVDPEENIYFVLDGLLFKAANVVHLTNSSLFRPSETALLNHAFPSPEILGIVSEAGATGLAVDPATGELFAATPTGGVEHFALPCEPGCAHVEAFGAAELNNPQGLAVDAASAAVYVADPGDHRVAVFGAAPYLPAALPSAAKPETPVEELLQGKVDPAGAGEITACSFEYVPASAFEAGGGGWAKGTRVDCSPKPPYSESHPTDVTADVTGLTYGANYRFRLLDTNAAGTFTSLVQAFTTLPEAPQIATPSVEGVAAEGATVSAQINPGGGDTAYRVQYLTAAQLKRNEEDGEEEFAGASQSPPLDLGSARTPQAATVRLTGLQQGTPYRFRFIATNASSPPGGTAGTAGTFITQSHPTVNDPCSNAHVRQQTSAASLLDCRAYELVSSANAGGYDVESNLIPGQSPFPGYPDAPGRVLYGIHDGGIPGTDHPTNRGVDPYVADRGPEGWSTEYVGIPADDPGASGSAPFSSSPSGADANLDTFAFGAPGGCSPCFEGDSTGVPLRLPDGKLVQGMAGSLDPGPSAKPDGHIAKNLSANGEHFVFGSKSKFEPGANEGELSIYDRNLTTEETHVVSQTPGGQTIKEEGKEIAELDISKDGSHILIGHLIEETRGVKYWHLYMNVGDSGATIDLTPTATKGVLFDGMTADGSKVFFSSEEHLTGEDTSHTGADIFMWEEGKPLTLISKGNGNSCDPVANSANEHWNAAGALGSKQNCGALAIGGGGGVSSTSGTIYFLSPENLTESLSCGIPCSGEEPVLNGPNLYRAGPLDDYAPHFIATLDSVLTAPKPLDLGHTFKENFGSFSKATALAVEHSSGDVYVLDSKADTVEKFDSSGSPVDFTHGPGAGTNKLTGVETPAGSFSELFGGVPPLSLPSQLAIDQSSGELYVPDINHNVLDKFSSSGEYEGYVKVNSPTGVAVDPVNGDVYVASANFARVEVFEPAAITPAGNGVPASHFAAGEFPTSVAVDSAADVYVTQFEGATESYSPSGQSEGQLDPNPSQSVIVDPSNEDVYVDEGAGLSRYSPSGKLLGTLGSEDLTESVGLALAPGGNLYATNSVGKHIAVFTATPAPGVSVDNPMVLDSVSEPEARHTADFQLTPSGADAAFPSALALAGHGEQTAGHTDIYRYDAPSEELACVSCNPAGTPSGSEASLASNGTSLSADGRVFFDTADPLVLADTDDKQDVYEWESQGGGHCEESSPSFIKAESACLALISTGTSTFDSGLLGADPNGQDVYFFTRDSIVPQDKNGPTMKIYDAREGGGFPYVPPEVECKSSDECHGPGSSQPPPIEDRTATPAPSEAEPQGCKRGYVKKHGACVKQHHTSKKRHRKRRTHKRGAYR